MPDAPQPDKAEFLVVEYLFEIDSSGQYSPKLRVQFGDKTFTLVDRERRKFRDLNDALKLDFDMAQQLAAEVCAGTADDRQFASRAAFGVYALLKISLPAFRKIASQRTLSVSPTLG